MIYLENSHTYSGFNLALEQYVFDEMPKNESYFMLWRNQPSVIIGKHQNTLEEVNAGYVREHGICVTRRLSGGGAVYHDLGNINYTFIVNDKSNGNIDFAAFCSPLLRILKKMGIQAEMTGRNDITVDGKKVSGNAQYTRGGRIMHHGTILYDTDLSVMQKALNVSKDKMESKGIKSVRSRVINLRGHMEKPVSTEAFLNILRQEFCAGMNAKEYRLTKDDLERAEKICKERYSTWEWNWGLSPSCAVRKERRIEGVGCIQIYLKIQKGRIEQCQFFGDFFGDGPSNELLRALSGCPLDYHTIMERLKGIDIKNCIYNITKEELTKLILQ